MSAAGDAGGADAPGVVAPPPLIYAAFLGLGLGLEFLVPSSAWPHGLGLAGGGVLISVSLALAFWSIMEFHKIGTHVDVRKPAIALATTGPYRISRNPIYLALTLLYLGIGFAAGSLWVLGFVIPALAVMHTGVIRREERYLQGKFGEAYLSYLRRVRRWI